MVSLGMSKQLDMAELRNHLPDKIWYLSSDGRDLYCRRPYSFLFSGHEAAQEFATAFGVEGVNAVGVDASALVTEDFVALFQQLQVTRLFIDPQIDPDTGDVTGNILRFAEPN